MKMGDIYWLAGILEGEGCFGIHNGGIFIKLLMTDQDTVTKVAILLKGNMPQSSVQGSNIPTSVGRPVSSSDHILGNINAKIVIVEYSDLECPFCKVLMINVCEEILTQDSSIV
mgnify:CR=1 FL=1